LASFALSETGNAGTGGNVTMTAQNNITNLEILTLSSADEAGAVEIKGFKDLSVTNTRILTSRRVEVKVPFFDEPITLEVGGQGQSGDVTVTSLGNLTFKDSSIESDTNGSDRAGNVMITSPSLVTFNNSQIISNTSNLGKAGDIAINAGGGITFQGLDSYLSVETSNAGKAGNIMINTPTLTLSDTARITATATNTATNPEGGGSISLNASTMNLAGIVGVFADTQGQTPAGTLTLKPYQNQSTLNLTLAPQSRISASTSGSGRGGNLEVSAPEAITIRGAGTLAVETTGEGAAGNLTIDTQRLTIADGATISASTASANPDGFGGNITINATESFTLNQAQLSAQSTGAAQAGNITINTGQLTATNGTIATSTEQSAGGAIAITAADIHLFGDSDITSRVASGAGGGGNITLTADSIIALDDSDILAFARDGKGGDITLTTPAFFGQNYQPAPKGTDPRTLDNNDRVDINATGAIEGVITITSDTGFIENSFIQLSGNGIDTDELIAESCIARRHEPQRGSFFITGTGGIPFRPGDAYDIPYQTGTVRSIPSEGDGEAGEAGGESSSSTRRPWKMGDPIIEPTGIYRLPNGKVIMSRLCGE
jgi:large exoprotein involved in heme utilization and adhesion